MAPAVRLRESQTRDDTRGGNQPHGSLRPSLAGQLKIALPYLAQVLVSPLDSLYLYLLSCPPSFAPVISSRRDNLGQFPPVPSFVGPCRSLPQGRSDDSSFGGSLSPHCGLRRAGGLGLAMLGCLLAGRQVGRRRHVFAAAPRHRRRKL